jgi:N-acetylneuraminate synthase
MGYFTSPYSIELVEAVAPYVSAFKLGSGDITWLEEIKAMGSHNVPLLIASGASTMAEVEAAMEAGLSVTDDVLLMQCNTEYTASNSESKEDRYKRYSNINLRVLETYARKWPGIPLGLSDHTHGAMTVLGAVGLFDCCAVEKHFTFDNSKEGQDHSFSMTPKAWSQMVSKTRALKAEMATKKSFSFEERWEILKSYVDDHEALRLAIGDGKKCLATNEANTVIVQRRAVRAAHNLEKGSVLNKSDIIPLRPCPKGAVSPADIDMLVGKVLKRDMPEGEHFVADDLVD